MRLRALPSALLLLLLPAALLRAAETKDYEISRYVLSFDTRENSADVRVEMEITYRIRSGTKSRGFKYIGNFSVTNLTGMDGDGTPIRAWVDHQRETRLNWSFSPTGPGEKKVQLTFSIPGALTGSRESNTLDAKWAGIFRVPVHDAVYRLLLPDDSERSISSTPGQALVRVAGGRRIVEIHETPMRNTTFRVVFAPGLTENLETVTRPSGTRSWGSREVFLLLAFIPVFFGAMMVLLANRAGGKSGSWISKVVGSSCGGGVGCGGGGSCGGGGGCGGGGCGG